MISFPGHPWDWLCHFISGLFLMKFKIARWWVIFSFGIYVEYEQYYQVDYYGMSFQKYVIEESLPDLAWYSLGMYFGYVWSKQTTEGIKK